MNEEQIVQAAPPALLDDLNPDQLAALIDLRNSLVMRRPVHAAMMYMAAAGMALQRSITKDSEIVTAEMLETLVRGS